MMPTSNSGLSRIRLFFLLTTKVWDDGGETIPGTGCCLDIKRIFSFNGSSPPSPTTSESMTPADLEILIQQGEGTTLEFKESLSSSFSRELVAMANTVGGKLLLGVRDDGTVIGVKDSNTLRARVQDIARNCDPPVKVLVEPVDDVLAVHVRESDAKPVQCS